MMWITPKKTPSYIESRLHLKKFAPLRKKVEHATPPRAYAWIEFPAWAADMPRLAEPVAAVCKSAKECEHYSGTLRVSDIVQNGRFSDLERLFQEVSVPYDCGGEESRCRSLWNGWWRKGFRHAVSYEVSSVGDQFVPLDELREVLEEHDENTRLSAAIKDLIHRSDSSAPIPLRDAAMPRA